MLVEIKFSVDHVQKLSDDIKGVWNKKEAKVFVLKPNKVPLNVRDFYEKLFPYLGTPAALAEDVNMGDRDHQRTGGVWTEVRYDSKYQNAYRHSANAQPLHTEGSYIPNYPNATLLVCVTNTEKGGETTFIDSIDVLACLKRENPELLSQLLGKNMLYTRSGDFRNDAVIRLENDDVFVNWNYYCVDKNISPELKKIVEEYQNFLLNSSGIKSRTIEVKLQPGDAVFWKDNYVLHGRNSFIANQESERFIWKCAIDIGVFS